MDEVDLSVSPKLLAHLTALETDVSTVWTGALTDFKLGLDGMVTYGALGLGLYTASRLVHTLYWAVDGSQAPSRWKQLAAITVGALAVGVGCQLATRGTRV